MAPNKARSEGRGQRQGVAAAPPSGAGPSSGGEPAAAGPAPNGGGSNGTNGGGNDYKASAKFLQMGESLIDATAYPLLTESINTSSPGRGSSSSGDGAAGFGQTVNTALREVLGWQLRAGDAKGFVGALTQSFALRTVEGHVESTWTPRTYAVQTDLSGGITGAQASLLTRTKQAVDASLPLLDGLYPLTAEADPEDSAALRSLVRGQMLELVNELGTLGGPRVLRVDEIFGLLLGHTAGAAVTGVVRDGMGQPADAPKPAGPVAPPEKDAAGTVGRSLNGKDRMVAAEALRLHLRGPEDVRGTLGLLRDLFKVRSGSFVNTVEEEQNLTNFRILADYMIGLERSWLENRKFFTRGQNRAPFFGTQLVLLSRQLSVIAESVGEVRFALDSVFIGPLERQALLVVPRTLSTTPELDFDQPPPSLEESVRANKQSVNGRPVSASNVPWWPVVHEEMFVEELLAWIEAFATQEGPRLIQDGGKLGVGRIFTPTVNRLYVLTAGMICPENRSALPEGYCTPRVSRAFHELAMQLFQLGQLAKNIRHRVDLEA